MRREEGDSVSLALPIRTATIQRPVKRRQGGETARLFLPSAWVVNPKLGRHLVADSPTSRFASCGVSPPLLFGGDCLSPEGRDNIQKRSASSARYHHLPQHGRKYNDRFRGCQGDKEPNSSRLWVEAVQLPSKRYCLSDVGYPTDPGDRPRYAQAETGVRHRPVATQIKVPLIWFKR